MWNGRLVLAGLLIAPANARFPATAILAALTIASAVGGTRPAYQQSSPLYEVRVVKLDSANGAHVTTRTSIRRVWKHDGRWYVYYRAGEPPATTVYRTSTDGVNWSERREFPEQAQPYFVNGRGYAHLDRGGPVAGESNLWAFRHWMAPVWLERDRIRFGERVEFFKEPARQMYFYYPQPRVDSQGRVCLTLRHADSTVDPPRTTIVWFRSQRPADLKHWDGPVEVIAGQAPGEGADGHMCLPLRGGKSMVLARTNRGHYDEDGPKGGFYARVIGADGWGKQFKLDTSDGTGGSDRRFSAAFEEKRGLVHLVYTDGRKRLVYRTCSPPYGPSDWSQPDYPFAGVCFTQSVGLDLSVTPATAVIVYGAQRQSDGGRLHAGELYLIRGHAGAWTKPLLVSEKGRTDNWYPNLVEDCSGEIGLLYLRNFYAGQRRPGQEALWDIMFARIAPAGL